MFSLAMVTTIGKLLFLPSQHDIWPQRESINSMLAETPFSGSDTELALSKYVLMEGRKERLNEASLFSEISSPPEPSPPALSLVLTPQGRLLGPTLTLWQQPGAIASGALLFCQELGGYTQPKEDHPGCRDTDSPRLPDRLELQASFSRGAVAGCCNCLFAWPAPSLFS